MPTGRNGRLWALILMLIAVGGVYLVVVPLVNYYAERQSVLENRRMLLRRARAKLPWKGASDAIASANLQGRIEELAASAGATVSSTEGLPAEVRGGYRRIGLRYVLVNSYETLLRLLAKLEAATPPLVIDNLHIQGGLRVYRRGQPATQGLATPALNAGLDVYGFRANENLVAAKP